MSLLGKVGGFLSGGGAGLIGNAIKGGIAGAKGGGGVKGALLGAGKGALGMGGGGGGMKTQHTDYSGKPMAGEKPPMAMHAAPTSTRGTSTPIVKKHVSARSFSGRRG